MANAKTFMKTYAWHPKTEFSSGTDYNITWDGTDVTGSTFSSPDIQMWEDEASPEILEDGPWSPLYEYEDYVGLMHAVLAMELGLDEEE